jgi:hypothetical protein
MVAPSIESFGSRDIFTERPIVKNKPNVAVPEDATLLETFARARWRAPRTLTCEEYDSLL